MSLRIHNPFALKLSYSSPSLWSVSQLHCKADNSIIVPESFCETCLIQQGPTFSRFGEPLHCLTLKLPTFIDQSSIPMPLKSPSSHTTESRFNFTSRSSRFVPSRRPQEKHLECSTCVCRVCLDAYLATGRLFWPPILKTIRPVAL
jgi:hypothetical protein